MRPPRDLQIVGTFLAITWEDGVESVLSGEYLREHGLPYHPLWEQGYISIGDTHSTTRYADGMKAEDTRFSGLKRECGLHELSGGPEYMI